MERMVRDVKRRGVRAGVGIARRWCLVGFLGGVG